MSSAGSESNEDAVLDYFNNHASIRLHQDYLLGQGANGSVYKVVDYNMTDEGRNPMTMAVKLSLQAIDPDGDDEDGESIATEQTQQLGNEVYWLRRFKGCPHIVQILDVNPDVRGDSQGGIPNGVEDWVCLEFMPFGTLEGLIGKYKDIYGANRVFPNRVLWRFFMCSCIEMSYHHLPNLQNRSLESLRGEVPSRLAHTDIKPSNILIGAHETGAQIAEHDLNPVLKLIDFGEAKEIDPAEHRNTQQMSLQEIGEVMIRLIRRYDEEDLAFYANGEDVTVDGQTFTTMVPEVATQRHEYTTPDRSAAGRTVDPRLFDLVCQCLARDPARRPSLIDLAIEIRGRVQDTSVGPPVGDESDVSIAGIWRECLLDARLPEPGKRERSKSSGEELEEDGDEDEDEEGPAPRKKLRTG